jgi:hypothetical protein
VGHSQALRIQDKAMDLGYYTRNTKTSRFKVPCSHIKSSLATYIIGFILCYVTILYKGNSMKVNELFLTTKAETEINVIGHKT